jgi:hypothetical protein
MKIRITENQYNKLIEQDLDLFDDVIEDVCGEEIDYVNFGYFINMVFVNLSDTTPDEREILYSRIKSSNCDIVLHNIITDEKFTLIPNDIKITNTANKKLYIDKSVYMEKIYPNLPPIEQFMEYISSSPIKEALKRAFSNNWRERTDTHVAGVVGVFPIKSAPNQWSIVNFFNTKETVKDRIILFLVRDYKNGKFIPNNDIEESVINWMTSLFEDVNSKDMLDLVKIQEKSIMDNYKQELIDAKRIQKMYHPNKKVEISGFGTIKDIEQGVDATIGGVTYQIKPLSKFKNTGESIFVSIGYSNANMYSDGLVKRMAFLNNNEIYVFNTNILSRKGNTYEFNKSDLVLPKPN